jgi:uncharacterized protein with NRDE domain
MCLLAVAWRVHPEVPFVFIGNRDEFHDRPSAPAGWWEDHVGVLGGRDLSAGGSWLAVTRGGRFAVVTNFREPGVPTTGRRSRGELVIDALRSGEELPAWVEGLRARGERYGGFNLVLGDDRGLHYATNRGPDRLDLPPGVYGLSNGLLDEPWPKVVAVRDGLRRAVEGGRPDPDPLFALLADTSVAADERLPTTGVPREWERALSAAFIVGDDYGTRASTVVLRSADAGSAFIERRFGPGGVALGESSYGF